MYTAAYLKKFTTELFSGIGCSLNDAGIIADVLVSAELRGIPSHGMVRIMDYIGLFEKNRINVRPNVRITHETPSTAVVDGDKCFGMIAGKYSMEIAIHKASIAGSGWVSAKNSNHYGIAGYYAMMALKSDMTGISMTNANPLVAPTWSVSRLLGTNPVAVAVPAGKYPPFVADFATTPIARGKLAIKELAGEKVETGFVQDRYGKPSADPGILKDGGEILPLGGDYEHGSHKGYCMGAVVDIFSAVFSGANFGPYVPPQIPYLPLPEIQVGEGLGHFFGAMRIDAFEEKDVFLARMDQWIETFRNAEPAKDKPYVMIPGDPERISEEKKLAEGISIKETIAEELRTLAKKYGISFEEK
ncbi:MAG: Ldh family oxidoreductase [Bacteroidota bacterium]